MKRSLILGVGALSVSMLSGTVALAQLPNEELICRPDEPQMDKYGYLRSLSLDLRGTVPTAEEYAQLDAEEDVPEAMIEEMLSSEAFVQRAVRRHRALLWNNVSNVNLMNYQTSMQRTSAQVYWRRRPAIRYRGDDVPCRNVPATFDQNGEVEYEVDNEGIKREGYIEVSPYWAPDTTIRVCAWDAQTTVISPSGTDCRTSAGFADVRCGCGENLRLCRYGGYSAITQALAQDVDLRVAAVIRNDEPYTELFTSNRTFFSGPMVHYLKHQTGVPAGVRVSPAPYQVDRLPELEFAADYSNWVEINMPGDHSGILTSPAYLLRFQTNRARANRFYEAFLCQPFSPPPGGLPPTDPDKAPDPDLQKRDGCKYCHALLEPAAAHWGRWTERGAGYLDPARFPSFRDDCEQCAANGQLCSRECRLYYTTRTFTAAEDPYVGQLNAFQFLREEHMLNVEMGPKFLVTNAVVDDRFPQCTARRAMEGMFGRELNEGEEEWLGALARSFVSSGYRYRELVKAIVMSPVYRRIR